MEKEVDKQNKENKPTIEELKLRFQNALKKKKKKVKKFYNTDDMLVEVDNDGYN